MNRSCSRKRQDKTKYFKIQSNQVSLNECCGFTNSSQWKLITKKGIKNSRTFLKLTVGGKILQNQSNKNFQSKQTRSMSLSRESSQVFEQAKNQFIEQLKLFRGCDSHRQNTQHTRRSQLQEKSSQQNPQLSLQKILSPSENNLKDYIYRQYQILRSNKLVNRKWIGQALQRIQEVETYFEVTSGLNTQNSSTFFQQ